MINSINFIKSRLNGDIADVLLVLGSGLNSFTDGIEGITIPYGEIDGFVSSNVSGHKGSLFYYQMFNKKIIVMQGRFHYYEGYSPNEITYPVKVFGAMGVKKVILTNAAGSLKKNLHPGELLLIKDHINFMGVNPLTGANDDSLGERFPDMSEVYSLKLRNIAASAAKKCKIRLKEGIYAATTGPSYETPAEVKMFKKMGADVIGMSTVPEAIIASWCKMEVLGLSFISNYASGIKKGRLNHKEVLEEGKKAHLKIKTLINAIIENI